MSVELTPLGVACNLSCPYCYQNPMRDAGNIGNKKPYDLEKMLAALDTEGAPFLVFGGEPLLVPLPDLEIIWAHGFRKWKQNGVQTNGVLITAEHIEAFKRYKVHVGFSLDGPDELNDSRWAGTLERTREATEKSHKNLKACIDAGVGTSVIVTLYKGNALPGTRPRLLQWIRKLDEMGVRGIRVHLLEVDHPLVRKKMQLTNEETIEALTDLVHLEKSLTKTAKLGSFPTREEATRQLEEARTTGKYPRLAISENRNPTTFALWSEGLGLDILTDMRALLRADDNNVTCIWNPCDPYTTSAVRGVDGQGNKSNCGRTNKDGIMRLKAQRVGYERQVALYHTPQEHGGCQGCRFFLMCKGQCPGTAIDGDWRNRSEQCQIWMDLFKTLEMEMLNAGELPFSLSPERTRLEQAMTEMWGTGRTTSMKQARERLAAGQTLTGTNGTDHEDAPHGDEHGDHTDQSLGNRDENTPQPHGDVPHADIPHGDEHGDHTDQALAQ